MRWVVFLVGLTAMASGARAAYPVAAASGYGIDPCRQAIAAAERRYGIPTGLLTAMGRVESGRRQPNTSSVESWPWTINAEGEGSFFDDKRTAIAAVRKLQSQGVVSIDVGCMQVNLMHHPQAFRTLEEAFDPWANADYAARFLTELFATSGNWDKAAGLYHSATPELRDEYQRKVMAMREGASDTPVPPAAKTPLASAWAATLGGHTYAAPFAAIPPRISMLNPSPVVMTGRGLDSYRAAPIRAGIIIRRIPAG